jgi:hypothetical protein
MLNSPARLLAFGLVFALVPWLTNSQATGQAPVDKTAPVARLVNTCLITANVDRLVQFYEPILALKAQRSGKDYAEFRTGAGVLAVFSAAAQEKYIPGSTEAAKNRSAILEFRVSDVDQEYVRPGICPTSESRQNLGQTTDNAALGYPFHLLPGP